MLTTFRTHIQKYVLNCWTQLVHHYCPNIPTCSHQNKRSKLFWSSFFFIQSTYSQLSQIWKCCSVFVSDWYTKYPAYRVEQIPGCVPSWRGSLSCQLEHWAAAGLEASNGTLAGWKIGWLVAEDRRDQLETEKMAWDWKCFKICNIRINII